MRNLILLAGVLAFSMSVQPFAQTKQQLATCKRKVTGMTCGGCEGAVKVAGRRVDGVKTVTASAKSGTAEVPYDSSKTSPEAIAKAMTNNSGFKAEVLKE